MKTGIRLLVLLMLLVSPVMAQQRGVEVTGKVQEKETQLPIEQASVRLLNVKDSSMVRGVASNTDGSFALKNVRKGNYILNVTYIGFDSLYKNISVAGTAPVRLGTLEMTDGSVRLQVAVITGKAPEVVVRNDTTEYNADYIK